MSVRKLSNGPACGWLTQKRKIFCVSMSGNLEAFAWKKNYWSERRPFSVIYNLLLKYFLFFSPYFNLLISSSLISITSCSSRLSFLFLQFFLKVIKKTGTRKLQKKKGWQRLLLVGPGAQVNFTLLILFFFLFVFCSTGDGSIFIWSLFAFDFDLPFVFFFSKLMNEILTFEHSMELSLFHEILCCGILLKATEL